MSSSLSELRNFRPNKGTNGNSSNKLATGRKRIRAMSDSSDDEHAKRASSSSPQKPIQNGTALTTKDKEERYKVFREIVDQSVHSLILQDFLIQNGWDVQKAFDALQEDPKYKNTGTQSSPDFQQKPTVSVNSSPNSIKNVIQSTQRDSLTPKPKVN